MAQWLVRQVGVLVRRWCASVWVLMPLHISLQGLHLAQLCSAALHSTSYLSHPLLLSAPSHCRSQPCVRLSLVRSIIPSGATYYAL